MSYISVNGKIKNSDEPVLLADSRGYRYGDGLFETMKIISSKIILEDFHFERLWKGMNLLKYRIPVHFSKEVLEKEILELCEKNKCSGLARVRLSVSAGNGGIKDGERNLQYIIECWPVSKTVNHLNENGLVIDVLPSVTKSTGVYSNLKSANFLPYTLAALHAKENKLNDCLVVNTSGSIADASIANIFFIKDNIVVTPSLQSGCVSGVMRQYILEKLKNSGYKVKQDTVSIADLETADEIFLTNAMTGTRWVKQFRNHFYKNQVTIKIFNDIIAPLFKNE